MSASTELAKAYVVFQGREAGLNAMMSYYHGKAQKTQDAFGSLEGAIEGAFNRLAEAGGFGSAAKEMENFANSAREAWGVAKEVTDLFAHGFTLGAGIQVGMDAFKLACDWLGKLEARYNSADAAAQKLQADQAKLLATLGKESGEKFGAVNSTREQQRKQREDADAIRREQAAGQSGQFAPRSRLTDEERKPFQDRVDEAMAAMAAERKEREAINKAGVGAFTPQAGADIAKEQAAVEAGGFTPLPATPAVIRKRAQKLMEKRLAELRHQAGSNLEAWRGAAQDLETAEIWARDRGAAKDDFDRRMQQDIESEDANEATDREKRPWLYQSNVDVDGDPRHAAKPDMSKPKNPSEIAAINDLVAQTNEQLEQGQGFRDEMHRPAATVQRPGYQYSHTDPVSALQQIQQGLLEDYSTKDGEKERQAKDLKQIEKNTTGLNKNLERVIQAIGEINLNLA